jgi:hypothetical protein
MPARIIEDEYEEKPISEFERAIDLSSLISKNGFLPAEQPLRRLPDTYYRPWEQILDNLPALLKQKTIRDEIGDLEILATSRLSTEPEWQRAYLILCFFTHGYIWGGDAPSEVCVTISYYRNSYTDLHDF